MSSNHFPKYAKFSQKEEINAKKLIEQIRIILLAMMGEAEQEKLLHIHRKILNL